MAANINDLPEHDSNRNNCSRPTEIDYYAEGGREAQKLIADFVNDRYDIQDPDDLDRILRAPTYATGSELIDYFDYIYAQFKSCKKSLAINKQYLKDLVAERERRIKNEKWVGEDPNRVHLKSDKQIEFDIKWTKDFIALQGRAMGQIDLECGRSDIEVTESGYDSRRFLVRDSTRENEKQTILPRYAYIHIPHVEGGWRDETKFEILWEQLGLFAEGGNWTQTLGYFVVYRVLEKSMLERFVWESALKAGAFPALGDMVPVRELSSSVAPDPTVGTEPATATPADTSSTAAAATLIAPVFTEYTLLNGFNDPLIPPDHDPTVPYQIPIEELWAEMNPNALPTSHTTRPKVAPDSGWAHGFTPNIQSGFSDASSGRRKGGESLAGRRFEVRSPDGKGAKVPVAIPAGMLAAMSRSRSELAESSEWEVVAVPGEAAEAREGHDPSLGGIGQQRDPTGRRRDSVDELDIEDLVL